MLELGSPTSTALPFHPAVLKFQLELSGPTGVLKFQLELSGPNGVMLRFLPLELKREKSVVLLYDCVEFVPGTSQCSVELKAPPRKWATVWVTLLVFVTLGGGGGGVG
jgi:hypothetical protein